MVSDIPRHKARELARRRLRETFARRGDIRFPDLLNYLEYVAVEPDGDDAFQLSRVLKEMRLDEAAQRELLQEAQQALRRAESCDYRRLLAPLLADARHELDRGTGVAPGTFPDVSSPSVGQPGVPIGRPTVDESRPESKAESEVEARERYWAQAAGGRIAGLIRSEQRRELRVVFAALAVAWLFVKPPPADTELYMDEVVRDLFPW